MFKDIINFIKCKLGYHDWYTVTKCTKPKDYRCWNGYCDGCSYLKDLKTVCLVCGKVKK